MEAIYSTPMLFKPMVSVARLLAALQRYRPAVREIRRQRTLFYRDVWREAATALGARIERLDDESLAIHFPGFVTRVERNHTEVDDDDALRRAGDKPLVLELLAAQGVPVPRWCHFTSSSFDRAVEFMRGVGGNCVVKPASGTGAGAGITTHVRQTAQLRRAVARAAVWGDELSIEEQVGGENYRLLYLDGVLLDAVLRRPPAVTGDGRSSLRALVDRLNRSRLSQGSKSAQTLLFCDLDMRNTVASQGLKMSSVPPAGLQVRLKTVVNDNAALDNVAATSRLCGAVIEAGARAASAVGVRLAGVDVITPDPSRPLAEVGGVVLEVNTTPGLYYHYHRLGEPSAVAVDILKYLCARRERSAEPDHAAIP